MDWASCSVNGLALNLWNFWRERKEKKKILEKSAAKSSEKISEIGEFSKKWVNGLGFFS